MDWAHLDLDAAEWRQPGKLTKNRDPHRLHLHGLALSILRARHEVARRSPAEVNKGACDARRAASVHAQDDEGSRLGGAALVNNVDEQGNDSCRRRIYGPDRFADWYGRKDHTARCQLLQDINNIYIALIELITKP